MTNMSRNRELRAVIVSSAAYAGMVAVNALANILPFNNVSTGAVSDRYGNLFAPAGITFSIWGLIYLLLGFHVVFMIFDRKSLSAAARRKMPDISTAFALSSITNAAWIFAWHYDYIEATLLLMLALLITLIAINSMIHELDLHGWQAFIIRMPFSIYFGWITVATIANVTVVLVKYGWKGWGIAPQIWTAVVIVVGALIGTAATIRNRDVAYGCVIIWAYAGIILKHVSLSGFNLAYPSVVVTAGLSIVVVLLGIARAARKGRRV